jgi:hypothetical protein
LTRRGVFISRSFEILWDERELRKKVLVFVKIVKREMGKFEKKPMNAKRRK